MVSIQCLPIVFINALHFSSRDNKDIQKLTTYIILMINYEGCKEVLSIQIGENGSCKYWRSTLIELKNREVKNILAL